MYLPLKAHFIASFWARDDETQVGRDVQELHILALWLRGGCKKK